MMVPLRVGDTSTATRCCSKLVDIQYDRNDVSFKRGKFRVRGDVVELWPAYEEFAFRIELFGDEIERAGDDQPAHRRGAQTQQETLHLPRQALRAARRSGSRRPSRRSAGARRAAAGAQGAGQAARGAAAGGPDPVRHRDAAGSRLLPGHRELLAPPLRPQARGDAVHADRLLPARQPADRRRVARDAAADPGDVRRRPQPQDDARRARLPPPQRARQPPAAVRRVGASRQAMFVSATPGRLRAGDHRRRGGRAGDPPDGPGRSDRRVEPAQGQVPAPAGRDQKRAAGRARAGHHADQAAGRRPLALHPGAGCAASGCTRSSTRSSG